MFGVELAGHITGLFNINNLWLYNLFFPVYYLLLVRVMQMVLTGTVINTIIRAFYVLFPVFVVVNSFYFQGIEKIQTLTIVIGGSFLIFLSAAYLRQLFLSDETGKITHDPFFWISCAFLLYFGGTVPFLGMYNELKDLSISFTRFYHLYFSNSFSILLNILIIVAFLCAHRYQRSLSS